MMSTLFEEVLKKIRPKATEVEKARQISDLLCSGILLEGFEPVVVGSRSRGTFISGSRDLDIFVYFPETMARNEFEAKSIQLGKRVLKKHNPTVHYAEHPYVKGNVEGLDVEIVPCYHMKDKIISAVDRSPLHDEYLKDKIAKKRDDVLLLKQFLRNNNIYGANTKTHGFSGVLCEVLVLHYGSFLNVITAAQGWKSKVIIDHEKTRDRYLKFENEPLVVIDPVDKERNMASAVSMQSLAKFVMMSQQFMKNQNIEFFFRKPEKIDLKKALAGRHITIVKFSYPTGVIEEIVWGQLERLSGYFAKQLEIQDFRVYRNFHYTDEQKNCWVVLETDTTKLSKFKKHRGPRVFDDEHVKNFIARNPNYWLEKEGLFAWKKRDKQKIEDLISELLLTPTPSHLSGPVKKAKIITGNDVLKEKAVLEQYVIS